MSSTSKARWRSPVASGRVDRGGGEGNENNSTVILAQGQVGLVRLPFGAVVLGEDAQAEDTCVELEAPPIVGADDGDVMYFVQLQHCFLW